jgi:beta-phosphoglucomutase
LHISRESDNLGLFKIGKHMQINAILFDFDGVIANTMDRNYVAWHAVLKNYGYHLEKRAFFLMEGMGARAIVGKLLNDNGIDADWQTIAKAKNAIFLKDYTPDIYPEIPAILDLLDHLNIPRAIVTGSDRLRLESILAPEFLARFQASVTLEDTERHKPYPDPYATGAEMLGVPPGHCLVVENAPAGIQAGKAAGATTAGVQTTLTATDLAGADVVFANHGDLMHWLKENL